jgi:hypothetical protein
MAKCPNCDTRLEVEAVSCAKCGAAFGGNSDLMPTAETSHEEYLLRGLYPQQYLSSTNGKGARFVAALFASTMVGGLLQSIFWSLLFASGAGKHPTFFESFWLLLLPALLLALAANAVQLPVFLLFKVARIRSAAFFAVTMAFVGALALGKIARGVSPADNEGWFFWQFMLAGWTGSMAWVFWIVFGESEPRTQNPTKLPR